MYQDRNLKDIAVGDNVVMCNSTRYRDNYARAIVTKVTKTQFVVTLQEYPVIDIIRDPNNRRDFERVEVFEVRFNKAGRVIKREEELSIATKYSRNGPNPLMTWKDLDAKECRKAADKLQKKLVQEVSTVNFKRLSVETLADIIQLVNSDSLVK